MTIPRIISETIIMKHRNIQTPATTPRKPIPNGTYGRIIVTDAWRPARPDLPCKGIHIITPHQGMTAEELREAAHLFNQIAETLS